MNSTNCNRNGSKTKQRRPSLLNAGPPQKRIRLISTDPDDNNGGQENPIEISLAGSGRSTPSSPTVSVLTDPPASATFESLSIDFDTQFSRVVDGHGGGGESMVSDRPDDATFNAIMDALVGDPMDEDICYGMLFEVKAQFLRDAIAFEDISVRPEGGLIRLKLLQQRNPLVLDDKDNEIAVLNMNTTGAMRSIRRLATVEYEVYALEEEWNQSLQKARGTVASTTIDLEMNIYGPVSKTSEVGKILSKADIYLQHPRFRRQGYRYDNPHYFSFEGFGITEPEPSPPDPMDLDGSESQPYGIDRILDEFTQKDQLRAAPIDTRCITTELQSYQKEAVDFIARREEEFTLSAFSLWDRIEGDEKESLHWQHAIVGRKVASKPRENFGGLIADEMGLGKTLSMLSSIYMSMDSARSFAVQHVEDRPVENQKPCTRATLVVVPSRLILDGWIDQISQHFAGDVFKTLIFHGDSRPNEIAAMINNDLVLTTYGTLSRELSDGNEMLHQIQWYRIVLDEAHLICRQNTKRFKATELLEAKYRWCLTGTPIQNSIDDLGALAQFLKVTYLSTAMTFRSNISSPLESRDPKGTSRLKRLLKSLCLRRTSAVLHLPEMKHEMYKIDLPPQEMSGYEKIAMASKQAMEDAICGIEGSQVSHGIFRTILELRLFCNHAFAYPTTGMRNEEEEFSYLQQSDQAACGCGQIVASINDLEDTSGGMFGRCRHLVCHKCISQGDGSSENGNSPSPERVVFQCSTCKVATNIVEESTKISRSIQDKPDPKRSSSKLDRMIQDILTHQHDDKSIVFSSWRRTITLISSLLHAIGIAHAVVDGSMSVPNRREQITRFSTDAKVPVLLMTLGTGSAGLNLTAASRIHIIEPQWNPSVERQAIGRAVRLGQKKQVTVVRYIVQESVEEYVQNAQEKKNHLAKVAWDDSDGEASNERMQKLMDLKSAMKLS